MTKHAPLKSIFSLALIAAFTSCDDDEPKIAALTTTQFNQDNLSIAENATAKEISITLNQSAPSDGLIMVSVTAENLNGFTTTPAIVDGKIELPVHAGSRNVTFAVAPIDNNVLNENHAIAFTIGSVSEGFGVGDKKNLSVTIVDNESPALVSFPSVLTSVFENSNSSSTVVIALSHEAPGSGSVEVSMNSTNAIYGVHYVTEPAAVNNKIILPIALGANSVEFKVIPLNDQLFNGDRNIQYSISQVAGAVVLGHGVTSTLKITDDELLGKGKGYSIGDGSWSYRRNYEYNEVGQVSKITWQQNTPGLLEGSYTYEYDASGKVIKMKESNLTETIYTWENGKIVKAESFRDGVLRKYLVYGYDAAGNVGESVIYHRQPNGEMALSFLFVYLYHLDGNIYKQLTYDLAEDTGEYILLSTKTWETYSDKGNPFTMVDILPNKTTQPNLPLSYRVEEGGLNLFYQLTYQFNADGLPTKRTATSTGGSEVANYEYY